MEIIIQLSPTHEGISLEVSSVVLESNIEYKNNEEVC